MGFVPDYKAEESFIETSVRTITVHPPETTRPIGFHPWPTEKPKKKRKKKHDGS